METALPPIRSTAYPWTRRRW